MGLGLDLDDKLIADIKAFIQDHPPPKLPANAMLSVEEFRRFGYTPRILYPVAFDRDIAKAEADIGFPIPNLLRRLYLEVSNGIAGFSYDIIGLQGGCAASPGTLVESYHDLTAAFKYLRKKPKPGLLPFCDWGCCILSCIDCTQVAAPIVAYDNGDSWAEGYTLAGFFEMWVKGNAFPSRSDETVTKEIINPFTKKKMTVLGRKKKHPPA